MKRKHSATQKDTPTSSSSHTNGKSLHDKVKPTSNLGPAQTLDQQLKSNSLSWKEKIELVNDMLNDTNFVFPRKTTFALDWITSNMQKSLAKSDPGNSESIILLVESWKLLDQLCQADDDVFLTLSRKPMMNIISMVLNQKLISLDVLKHVEGVLNGMISHRTLFSLEPVAGTLKDALLIDSNLDTLVELLIQAWIHSVKHAGNPKRLFSVTIDNLLIPTLSSMKTKPELVTILKEGLFQPESLDFRSALESLSKGEKDKAPFQAKLFLTLPEAPLEAISEIPRLFSSYVERSRQFSNRLYAGKSVRTSSDSSFLTEFLVFVKLYEIMMEKHSLHEIPDLLEVVNDAVIYRPANVAHAKEQLNTLEKILEAWIDLAKQNNELAFRVFLNLGKLEFDVIDKNLDKILTVAHNHEALTTFVVDLLHQYTRARRLQDLLVHLLKHSHLDVVLDLTFLMNYCDCISQALPDQVLEICASLAKLTSKVAAVWIDLAIKSTITPPSHRQKFDEWFLGLDQTPSCKDTWNELLLRHTCLQNSVEYAKAHPWNDSMDLIMDSKFGHLYLAIALFYSVDDVKVQSALRDKLPEALKSWGKKIDYTEKEIVHPFQVGKQVANACVTLLLSNLTRLSPMLSLDSAKILVKIVISGCLQEDGFANFCTRTFDSLEWCELVTCRDVLLDCLMERLADLLKNSELSGLVDAVKQNQEWKTKKRADVHVGQFIKVLLLIKPGYLTSKQVRLVISLVTALENSIKSVQDLNGLEKVKSRLLTDYSDLNSSLQAVQCCQISAESFLQRFRLAWRLVAPGKASQQVTNDIESVLTSLTIRDTILSDVFAIVNDTPLKNSKLLDILDKLAQKSLESSNVELMSEAWKFVLERKSLKESEIVTMIQTWISRLDKLLLDLTPENASHACLYMQMISSSNVDYPHALFVHALIACASPWRQVKHWHQVGRTMMHFNPNVFLQTLLEKLDPKRHDNLQATLELLWNLVLDANMHLPLRKALKDCMENLLIGLKNSIDAFSMQSRELVCKIIHKISMESKLLPHNPRHLVNIISILSRLLTDSLEVYLSISSTLTMLVRARTSQVLEGAHFFIPLVTKMLQHLQPSHSTSTIPCVEAFSNICQSVNMSAIQTSMVKTSKPFGRYLHPVIATCCMIQSSRNPIVDSEMQRVLTNGMYSLLDVCDNQHDRDHILAILSPGAKQVFKQMVENWQKDWKFTGK